MKSLKKNQINIDYLDYKYPKIIEKTMTKKYIPRNINKVQILLFKLIIYHLLFPFYLSQTNPFVSRKLDTLKTINIIFVAFGKLNYISENSKILPKIIYAEDQIFRDYKYKTFNFLINGTYNLTLEFSVSLFRPYLSFESLFEDMTYLKSVDLSHFNLKVTNMANMFKNCKMLEYVNFGNFDTSSVTSMEYMFYNTNLKFLDLSKFDTSSVTIMSNMFSESTNLLYLNMNNFNTKKVKYMKKMFYNCKSLMFLNLYSFQEVVEPSIDDMATGTNKDLIYCIDKDKAKKIADILKKKTSSTSNICDHKCFQNSQKLIPNDKTCIDDCNQDDIYKHEYNNICYNYSIDNEYDESINEISQPNHDDFFVTNYTEENHEENEKTNINENTNKIEKYNEIIENCSTEDFFKGLCKKSNQTLSTEKKDNMVSNIVENIINGNLSTLLSEIENGESNDLYIKEDDVIFQITTTKNQNNNQNDNVSTINLGNCENILKSIYNISPNDSLIIFKIDYFMEGLLIPIIGYEVFHPRNYSKLDLDYCQDELINYYIPVSINEDEIEKYDPNSAYYKDECTLSTSEDGTDIILTDRQKEYNDNNMSLCENKCNFTDYNKNSKKSVCICEIKTKIYSIIEILESKEKVSKEFNTEKTETSSSSINLMKCYNALFSKYGLIKNIGNYILLLIIITFSSSSIFFYKIGYNMLDNDIKQILSIKEKNEENYNIYKYDQNGEIKQKRKKKKRKSKKSMNFINISNPTKKIKKKRVEATDSINTGKDINIHKSFSKLDIKNQKCSQMNTPQFKEMSQSSQFKVITYTEYELNTLSYKEALEKDKRTYQQYYFSLIRFKHPLIFSFIPVKDYNSMITKVDLFLIGFVIIYAMNALFFNESTIHQIYADKGAYNFGYCFPKILLSFLIGHIIYTGIKYIFLSERNILKIKYQETRNKALDIVDDIKRCLIIKYIIFYILGVLFLILFWYYLSSFCAVYQNSQIFLIINTFISSFFSLVYPFFINLLPTVFRFLSFKNRNREYVYKASIILQII